jgi:hypothetical protein
MEFRDSSTAVRGPDDTLAQIRHGERTFPMQQSRASSLPWAVAEAIYEHLYAPLYGRTQTLETIAKRGGFSYEEVEHMAWVLSVTKGKR